MTTIILARCEGDPGHSVTVEVITSGQVVIIICYYYSNGRMDFLSAEMKKTTGGEEMDNISSVFDILNELPI